MIMITPCISLLSCYISRCWREERERNTLLYLYFKCSCGTTYGERVRERITYCFKSFLSCENRHCCGVSIINALFPRSNCKLIERDWESDQEYTKMTLLSLQFQENCPSIEPNPHRSN